MSESEPHVSTREFGLFRQDVKEHFNVLHDCDKRIENKIDALIEKIDPLLADYQAKKEQAGRRWDVKLAVFGASVGLIASVATAAIVVLFRLG